MCKFMRGCVTTYLIVRVTLVSASKEDLLLCSKYLVFFRILASIVILGKACDLIDHHENTKKYSATSSPHKTSMASMASTTSEMASPSKDVTIIGNHNKAESERYGVIHFIQKVFI